jgi:hypothetical protein
MASREQLVCRPVRIMNMFRIARAHHALGLRTSDVHAWLCLERSTTPQVQFQSHVGGLGGQGRNQESGGCLQKSGIASLFFAFFFFPFLRSTPHFRHVHLCCFVFFESVFLPLRDPISLTQ